MPVADLGPLPGGLSGTPDTATLVKYINMLGDQVAELQKQLEYSLNGNLDSTNAREFGGWQIGMVDMQAKSGTVGFSSFETPADVNPGADDLRIWAGSSDRNSAPFRVYESGRLVATDGNFTGDITGSTMEASVISASVMNASEINASTMNASTINASTMNASTINAGTINSSNMFSSNIVGNTITGGTITGSIIKTDSGPEHIELVAAGFHAYDGFGVERIGIYNVSNNPFLTNAATVTFMFPSGAYAGSLGTSSSGSLRLEGSGGLFLTAGLGNSVNLNSLSVQGTSDFGGSVDMSFINVNFTGAGITGLNIGSISGLQAALDSKANASATHFVTVPDHNHGNPDNATSGGGTFIVF